MNRELKDIYIYIFYSFPTKFHLRFETSPSLSNIWKQLWKMYLYGMYILEKLTHNSTLCQYQRLSKNSVTWEHFHQHFTYVRLLSCSFHMPLPTWSCTSTLLALMMLRHKNSSIHSNYYFKEPIIYQTLSVVTR